MSNATLMSLDRTIDVPDHKIGSLVERYQQRPWLYAIERTRKDAVAIQRIRGDWSCLVIRTTSPFWQPLVDIADGYTPITPRRTDDDCENCCVCSASCPQSLITSQCCPDCFDRLYPA